MILKATLLASVAGCLLATGAHANVVTFAGSTASGPTYDRLDVDASGTPVGVSPTGTAVTYSVYSFGVSTAGIYSLQTAGGFDTYTFLYSSPFTPAMATTNALIGNDDLLAGIGTSGFSLTLNPGTTYSYVTTSFLNGQGGTFSTTINGDGTIVPVTLPVAVESDPKLLTYTGSTTGGATYNRADDLATLSTDGSSVAYQTIRFKVGAIGTYSFLSSGDYDTFLSLYAGGFDPSNPLANLVDVNDDYLRHTSDFADDLVPGITYTLVESAFANGESGFFSNAIVGPGAVTQVPEPAMGALMLSGLMLVGVRSRRTTKHAR